MRRLVNGIRACGRVVTPTVSGACRLLRRLGAGYALGQVGSPVLRFSVVDLIGCVGLVVLVLVHELLVASGRTAIRPHATEFTP
jgi:hypothetical protein